MGNFMVIVTMKLLKSMQKKLKNGTEKSEG